MFQSLSKIGKFAVESLSGHLIGSMSGFGRLEHTEVMPDAVLVDARPPSTIADSMHALPAASVVHLPTSVALVVRAAALAEIAECVVGPVSIDMIDELHPPSTRKREREAMRADQISARKIHHHVARTGAQAAGRHSSKATVE
nr:hypothetical protein [Burkholderia gladioli]